MATGPTIPYGDHPTWVQMNTQGSAQHPIDLAAAEEKGANDPSQVRCAICLEYHPLDQALMLKCGHQFGILCIPVGENGEPRIPCPTCRQPADSVCLMQRVMTHEDVSVYEGGRYSHTTVGCEPWSISISDLAADRQARKEGHDTTRK